MHGRTQPASVTVMTTARTLTRNLTSDKLRLFLEQEPNLSSLAPLLGDGVDSNLLIETASLKDSNALSLNPYFEGATIGALGALYIKLRWLVELESSEAKLHIKEKRTILNTEKAAKLKAAMEFLARVPFVQA